LVLSIEKTYFETWIKYKADMRQESVRGIQWVKNYKFDFRFQPWGQCSVTFTCVAGHIVAQDFNDRFKKWNSCPPAALFEAPIVSSIAEVSDTHLFCGQLAHLFTG
jgi:hypothetical protein